jgi:hypothetical protein|tara:strand:+ start:138 stop:377 length:240 start_codon:yes stop_codon:yes gene_type:complete
MGLKYIGVNKFDTKVTIKSGGGEVTGSFSVDGAIKEKGLSIPTLIEKMVVDRLGSDGGTPDFLNFVPITDDSGEIVITD